MKIFSWLAGLAAFLMIFAACGDSYDAEYAAVNMPGVFVAPDIAADEEEDEDEDLSVTSGFGRFVAEAQSLGAATSTDGGTDFEVIQTEDESFVIDVAFPVTDNYMLNTVVRELVFSRIRAFQTENSEGHMVARSQVFRFNQRVLGLTVDFRSYGIDTGFNAAKYAINFDLAAENFISIDDVFTDDADFAGVLAEHAAEDLYGRKPDHFEMFNFDDDNFYLHVDLGSLFSHGAGFHTVAIPLEKLEEIWQTGAFGNMIEHRGYVALTFDDGPIPDYTPALLDALKERGVPATFFLLGSQVTKHPEIVTRMYEEGHLIGNHSYNHPILSNIGRNRAFGELERTSDGIEEITGSRPRVLRPPYGVQNETVLAMARELDMSVILWSVDPRDWQYRDAETVRDHVVSHVNDGSVILLHDVRRSSIDAAVLIIDALTAQGYTFVTVEELFQHNAMHLEAGQVYHSIYRSAARRGQ